MSAASGATLGFFAQCFGSARAERVPPEVPRVGTSQSRSRRGSEGWQPGQIARSDRDRTAQRIEVPRHPRPHPAGVRC